MNSFQNLLDKLSKKKLLTHQDEIYLSNHIRKFKIDCWRCILKCYEKEIIYYPVDSFPIKTPEFLALEADKYCKRMKESVRHLKLFNDEDAENAVLNYEKLQEFIAKFAEPNSKLVIQQMHAYKNFKKYKIDDIFSEGYIGLIKAIHSYDPNTGNKFSTLAVWYIKNEIQRSFVTKYSDHVNIPVHLHDKYWSIKKAKKKLIHKYLDEERIPIEEIERVSKISIKHIKKVRKLNFFENELILDGEDDKSKIIKSKMNSTPDPYSAEIFIESDDQKKLFDDILEDDSLGKTEKIFISKFLEEGEFNAKEIAKATGLTVSSIKYNKGKILERIKKALIKKGILNLRMV